MNNLKIGDEVLYVSGRGYYKYRTIEKIEGETPKMWVVRGHKFKKDDGREYGGDGSISVPTKADYDEFEIKKVRFKIKSKISELEKILNNNPLSLAAIKRIDSDLKSIIVLTGKGQSNE